MTTRRNILLAVANLTGPGYCTGIRMVAKHLDISMSTVYAYFNDNSQVEPFENGDLLQWMPKLSGTLSLSHNAGIIRHRGKIINIGRVELMNNPVTTFNHHCRHHNADYEVCNNPICQNIYRQELEAIVSDRLEL